MPVYRVKGPDGRVIRVNAPEGASEQDAIEYVATHHYDITPEAQAKKFDPTEGMSTTDKVLAGTGKAMVDTWRGVKQIASKVGIGDEAAVQKEIDESKALDAPLMNTGAGMAGNVAGHIAMMVAPGLGFTTAGKLVQLPKMVSAGARMLAPKTIQGAAAQGAALGAVEPIASDDTNTRAGNMLRGGVGGAILPAGIGAARVARSVIDPFYKGGREKVAGAALERFATDAGSIRNARAGGEIPGSQRTLAEATDDVGLSQLQRSLLNNPDSAAPLTGRLQANNQARADALRDMSGKDGKLDYFKKDRATVGDQMYDIANSQMLHDTPWAKGQITQLQQRPAFNEAMQAGVELALNKGVKINPENATQVAHYAKKALDSKISQAARAGADPDGFISTRDKLVSLMESQAWAPAYRDARQTYAQMSKPINQMEVAGALHDQFVPALTEHGARRYNAASYAKALRDPNLPGRATDFPGATLENVMEPGQLRTLNGIADELGNSTRAAELGMAKGSPTVQNLVGQNFLRQVMGPVGAPASWAEAALPNAALRLGTLAAKPVEAKAMQTLGEAAADPVAAQRMLALANKRKTFDEMLDERLRRGYAGPAAAGTFLTLTQ